MEAARETLEKRYKLGSTVEGTRSFHHFQPLAINKIQAKYLSTESNHHVTHTFGISPEDQNRQLIDSLKINDYITCIYGDHWWLALVTEIDREQKDAFCKFMHPRGYSENFHWPAKDEAFVPFIKILLKVETPKALSISGRHYSISKLDLKKTVEGFSKRK